MPMPSPRRPLAALALLAALAACRTPLRFGPEGEITDPAYVLRRLDARAQALRSIKAEARASLEGPSGSGTVSELVAVRRPASLHLETLNFFGKPVAVLATDGTTFGLYVEEGNTYYSGPASAENLARLLPVPLEPEEAAAVLLGEIPRLQGAEMMLELDVDARAYRITLSRANARQTIWVATEDLRPLRSQTRGVPGYDLSFDDFETFEGISLPTSIALKTVNADGSPAGTELSLRYREPQPNAELDEALFSLDPVPGARQVQLDASGTEIGNGPLQP